MPILQGFVIIGQARMDVETRLKRKLHPGAYTMNMSGHRVLVGLDKADEMHKGVIHKPTRSVENQQMTQCSGWVIAVGPLVGSPGAPHPVGIVCEHPADLLGQHVYFQHHTGKVFAMTDDVDEWGNKDSLIIITDRDLQCNEQEDPDVAREA